MILIDTFIDSDDCSDCRSKLEKFKLVFDFKIGNNFFYKSIKKINKGEEDTNNYIMVENKAHLIFSLTKEEYDKFNNNKGK